MEIVKILSIALCAVIACSVLKGIKPEFAIYTALTAVIILFIFVADKLLYAFSFLEDIYGRITYGEAFFPVIIKVLAVAYLTDFTAQLCRDCGEGAIGVKVELAGKIVIFCLAIPVIMSILELIEKIL